jgi:hypothetical protein
MQLIACVQDLNEIEIMAVNHNLKFIAFLYRLLYVFDSRSADKDILNG